MAKLCKNNMELDISFAMSRYSEVVYVIQIISGGKPVFNRTLLKPGYTTVKGTFAIERWLGGGSALLDGLDKVLDGHEAITLYTGDEPDVSCLSIYPDKHFSGDFGWLVKRFPIDAAGLHDETSYQLALYIDSAFWKGSKEDRGTGFGFFMAVDRVDLCRFREELRGEYSRFYVEANIDGILDREAEGYERAVEEWGNRSSGDLDDIELPPPEEHDVKHGGGRHEA